MNSDMPTNESAANGTLMKNTQRHEIESVSHPPSVGPISGPSIEPSPNTAIALAWRSGGLMSSSVAWLSGISPAPHAPCSSRATTIIWRLVAAPHSTEATANPATEPSIIGLRP